MRVILVVLALIYIVDAFNEWTPEAYPNPRKNPGFKQCGMRSVSNICDPDQILSESDRYRLNHELSRLTRTGQNKDFCARKGIDAVLVVVPEGSQKFTDDLAKKWSLDNQCHKSALFLYSSDERRVYYSGQENTGINADEFDAIAFAAKSQLSAGHIVPGLTNIFKELGKIVNPDKDGQTTPIPKAVATKTSNSWLQKILQRLSSPS